MYVGKTIIVEARTDQKPTWESGYIFRKRSYYVNDYSAGKIYQVADPLNTIKMYQRSLININRRWIPSFGMIYIRYDLCVQVGGI